MIPKNLFRRIRHKLFVTVMDHLVFRESGYQKNHLGSILSPLQVRIAWDPTLSARALEVLELLSHKPDPALQRIGSDYDGGYWLPPDSLNCRQVISGGIGDDNNFEITLGNFGMKVLQWDPTIDCPPKPHEQLQFVRESLGEGGSSLYEALDVFEENFATPIQNGILKLDIEGSEWSLLTEFSNPDCYSRLTDAFSFVIIELHGLTSIHDEVSWKKVSCGLSSLLAFYEVINVVGNNCREFIQIGGVPMVDIVEVTLRRKSLDSRKKVQSAHCTVAAPRNIPKNSPLYLNSLLHLK